ncbi:MAG: DNA-binding protein WhiA [Lachnospiraceae bacterium]|nr:DNA-binding protein WhiA [Lachnospiraceae bacterium]MBO6208864.1 DNA-binding protein WhiA [Lachnospiraceae bacterium]
MSFSSEVKSELDKQIGASRHCQIAEMAAYVANIAKIQDGKLRFHSENDRLLKKVFTLLQKTYSINSDEEGEGSQLTVSDAAQVAYVTESVHYAEMQGGAVSPLLLKNSCCRRAYLRGCFACIGSMSDPEKSYHLEFYCSGDMQAGQLLEVLQEFGIMARSTVRKGHTIVYLKESEAIAEFLNVAGAVQAMMELENLRIEKELRGDANRRVNCDTANIQKTLNAAERQLEDIRYLERYYGLQRLNDPLRQMAEVRLEYPEATLAELGELLDPHVGKSGVNHRLRKLSEIAEEHRNRNS